MKGKTITNIVCRNSPKEMNKYINLRGILKEAVMVDPTFPNPAGEWRSTEREGEDNIQHEWTRKSER